LLFREVPSPQGRDYTGLPMWRRRRFYGWVRAIKLLSRKPPHCPPAAFKAFCGIRNSYGQPIDVQNSTHGVDRGPDARAVSKIWVQADHIGQAAGEQTKNQRRDMHRSSPGIDMHMMAATCRGVSRFFCICSAARFIFDLPARATPSDSSAGGRESGRLTKV
jgi:hypothetical protein